MTRLAATAALALVLLAGVARADAFAVVSPSVPSAQTPNRSGSLVLPRSWTERAGRGQQLSSQTLERLWRRAGATYGIPWEVLAAINEIESDFGRNMGPSSAGAVGWMQFMPDTWLRWGMDGNGDGVADPWNAEDAVFSAARYLAAAGGRTDLRRGVYAYNHADWYVEDVLRLAALYGGGSRRFGSVAGAPSAPNALTGPAIPGGAVPAEPEYVLFSLDGAQLTLEQAGREVATATDDVAEAEGIERALARAEKRLLARGERAGLLSERLRVMKRAAHAGRWRAQARHQVERLREVLDMRNAALRRAREAARNAPALTTISATPLAASDGSLPLATTVSPSSGAAGGYVFPVGGGPAVVSTSQTHHDYPAADIAAPMGSPLYALANATVVTARHGSDGRCGIGMTLRTTDGQTWTYCHLSYLDPRIQGGTALSAGAPVGLVGSTGNSTGPHLHLQLNPADSFPQDQAWFRSFAGSAFRWQDGEPMRPLVATLGLRSPAKAAAAGGPARAEADVVTFTTR